MAPEVMAVLPSRGPCPYGGLVGIEVVLSVGLSLVKDDALVPGYGAPGGLVLPCFLLAAGSRGWTARGQDGAPCRTNDLDAAVWPRTMALRGVLGLVVRASGLPGQMDRWRPLVGPPRIGRPVLSRCGARWAWLRGHDA